MCTEINSTSYFIHDIFIVTDTHFITRYKTSIDTTLIDAGIHLQNYTKIGGYSLRNIHNYGWKLIASLNKNTVNITGIDITNSL